MDVKIEELPSFNKICRTCLSEDVSLKKFLNQKVVIDEVEFEMSFVLEICTSIQVAEEDLPTLICSNCEERLCNAYLFRQQALKSEETLRNYNSITAFHAIKNEDESSELYFQDNSNDGFYEDTNCKEEQFLVEKVSDDDLIYEKCDPDYQPANNSDSDPDYGTKTQRRSIKKKNIKIGKGKYVKNDIKRIQKYEPDVVTEVLKEIKIKNKSTLVKCQLCGYIAVNRRGLSLHIAHIHKEMKNRWCPTCYIEVENLEEHKKTHCERSHKCTFCDKSFRHQGHLTEHIRSHSGERPHKCDTCDKGFVSARHLRIHERVHTGEKPYQCDICLKRFTQKGALASHHKKHNEDKNYKCKICDLTFFKLDDMAKHIIDSSHGQTQPLDESKTSLDEKGSLDIEDGDVSKIENTNENIVENINNDESGNLEDKMWGNEGSGPKYVASIVEETENDFFKGSAVCQVCNKTFSTHTKLRVHMRLHTGDTPHSCTFCKKGFCTRAQLDVHIRTHTGEKPHVCHICGKGFAQSSVLNTHMKLHTGRPEQCSICGQRFCRPAELRNHMRKHTGEKPFLCTECGQAFIQSSHLVEHKRTHSDERPYPCPLCKRAFKHKTTLRSHVQIHTGEKPYKCKYCSYACRQSYSLTQHMRQHGENAEKPHECPACWKRYSSLNQLKAHTESAHEVVIVK